jgi:hypothetical protein
MAAMHSSPIYKCCFSLLCIAAIGNAAFAASSWSQELKLGELAEAGHQYDLASTHYQKALAQVGSNNKAKLQALCALAEVSARSNHLNVAQDTVPKALSLTEKLRSAHQLDSDELTYLTNIIEACDYPDDKAWARSDGREQKVKLLTLSLLVSEGALPQKDNFNRVRELAIWATETGEFDRAINALQRFSKRADMPHSERDQMIVFAAAIVEKSHRPDQIKKLAMELKGRYSQFETLRMIFKGQIWADNFASARETVEQMSQTIVREKQPSYQEKQDLEGAYQEVLMKSAHYREAESHIRKSLQLASKREKNSEECFQIKHALAACLRRQNKSKEADALEKPSGAENDWLTDKEQADLTKFMQTSRAEKKN